MRHEVTTRRVLYEIPGMQSVRVRKDEFTGANGQPLPLEIYEATAPRTDPAPIVAIVEGYPDPGFEQRLGCKFMEMAWSISMARLIAASGMTAITHSNRDPEPDALALMDQLTLDSFVARAIAKNRPITLANYPEAPHSFELVLDGPETRRILQQGLDFLRAHLM